MWQQSKHFLCLILATFVSHSFISGQEQKPAKSWPLQYRPSGSAKVITFQKGNENQPYIYYTKHYEFHSTQAINARQLQKFATIAESVADSLEKIPLPLVSFQKEKRAKILIYPDEGSFVEAGGAIGAAGYYSGLKKVVMLRADSFLKAPVRAGSRLPPKPDYDLLVHELTHLCMHDTLGYLPRWFSEGVAEYMAAAHENDGIYRFDKINANIRDRIRRYRSQDKDRIKLLSINTTMSLTMQTWRERIEMENPDTFYQMYGSSLLLVHSLFHGGETRRQATREFLTKIKDRKPLNDKVEQLIKQNDRAKLQKKLVRYWHPKGLRIEFID